jgi:hypothetical protein
LLKLCVHLNCMCQLADQHGCFHLMDFRCAIVCMLQQVSLYRNTFVTIKRRRSTSPQFLPLQKTALNGFISASGVTIIALFNSNNDLP